MNAFAAWSQLYANLYGAMHGSGIHPKAQKLVGRILSSNDQMLHNKAKKLNEIIGQRISVLPPDTRHVDYEVIPLTIADGCLYHCDFCCVKSPQQFRRRSKENIDDQIQQLKDLYGRNLENYNALFLGNHDALAAGGGLINFAAIKACQSLGLSEKVKPSLFLFGSVDSLLNSKSTLFESLNRLPFYTYINIGFESLDETTLSLIGKPINGAKVRDAFQKMLSINDTYANIEITGNFLLSDTFPEEHDQSLIHLLRNLSAPSHGKGAIYLSAIKDSPKKRELLPKFLEIKRQSQLPVFIYIIQRL